MPSAELCGGVRPAHFVEHQYNAPAQIEAELKPALRLSCGSAHNAWDQPARGKEICQDENRDFKESGSSPTSPPRRTYSSLASVSAGTNIVLDLPLRFSLARKFPFLESREPDCGDPGAEDESARLRGDKTENQQPSRWVNR